MSTSTTTRAPKQGYKVSTWANGFGIWSARVVLTVPVTDTPQNLAGARAAARRAITRELSQRGAIGEGFRIHVARVVTLPPDTDGTRRPISTVTYKERV